MKKLFIAFSIVILAACGDQKTESMKSGTDSITASTTTMADVTYPYDISYSSKFKMAEPKYAQTILTLWKDWDNGDLSAHKDMFADSIEMHFADGSMMHSVRDSVVAAAQSVRNMFTSAVSSVFTVTSLRSTDKNENWALIWGKEIDKDKNGKVDSFYLQETWRFNKDGKTDLLYQYKAAAMPPKQ